MLVNTLKRNPIKQIAVSCEGMGQGLSNMQFVNHMDRLGTTIINQFVNHMDRFGTL